MAKLTGYSSVFGGDVTNVDTTAQHTLGTRARDTEGNEYVYMAGTASVIAGSWVVYRNSNGFVNKLAAGNDVGSLAVAMAATVTDRYGWFQIFGKVTTALNLGAIAADKALFLTATAGYVDDADVAGDSILGAISVSANTGSAFSAWISYPFVDDIAHD